MRSGGGAATTEDPEQRVWCPQNHQLHRPATKARAAALLRVGWKLSQALSSHEVMDWWVANVMTRVLPYM